MSSKKPSPASAGKKKGTTKKRGRGRPPKHGERAVRVGINLPPSVLDALRRYAAHEEAEGRERPSPSDTVMRALADYRPLAGFLTEKGLVDIFRPEK